MKDYNIHNASNISEARFASGRKSPYTKLKTEYNKFKVKLENSDFVNSSVALSDELDFLVRLKELAEKEKLHSELKFIQDREKEIHSILDRDVVPSAQAYYQPNLDNDKNYSKLTKEYTNFLKELNDPTYANTLDAVYAELGLIFKMKKIAQASYMTAELSWLEPREKELTQKLQELQQPTIEKTQEEPKVQPTQVEQEQTQVIEEQVLPEKTTKDEPEVIIIKRPLIDRMKTERAKISKDSFEFHKKKYVSFLKKTKEIDVSKDTMLLYDELGLIFKLRKAAEKEQFPAELEWIHAREQEILNQINSNMQPKQVESPDLQKVEEQQTKVVEEQQTKVVEEQQTPVVEEPQTPVVEEQQTPVVEEETTINQLETSVLGSESGSISETATPINKETIPDVNLPVLSEEYQNILDNYAEEDIDTTVAKKLLANCQENEIDAPHALVLLNKTMDYRGNVDPKIVDTIISLANEGITSVLIEAYLDGFVTEDKETLEKSINTSGIKKTIDFQKQGVDCAGAIALASYIENCLSNYNEIEKVVTKLLREETSAKTIVQLLDSLGKINPATNKTEVSPKTLNLVSSLKKLLVSTRNNETKERQNPINLLDVITLTYGDNTLVMKNGKITYSTPIEGKSYSQTKEEYETMISSIEDSMLVDFVEKYKDESGEIDSKYLRVASQLRKSGIVYNQLFNLIDTCIKEDGSIDSTKLDVIKNIKTSGALCDDISMLMDLCQKEDGQYDKEVLQLVCDLTETVVSGKDVCSLVPEIKDNEMLSYCTLFCSELLDDKSNLMTLVNLAKDSESKIDENRIEIIYDLAKNLYSQDNEDIQDAEFMQQVEEIIDLACGKDGVLSDDATGICAILCTNSENPETIKKALRLCTDKTGNINSQLAEILWKMGVQKSDFEDMKTIIETCVNDDLSVDSNKAQKIINLIK